MSTFTRSAGASHPNRKLTEQEWTDLLDRAYGDGESEMTIEALCKEAGVSRGRFYAKRKQRLEDMKKSEHAGPDSLTNSEAGNDDKSLLECTSQSSTSTNEQTNG